MTYPGACRVCAGIRLSKVLRVEKMPACCNLLLNSQAEAITQPTAPPISLTFCGQCGHLLNTEFDQSLIDYRPGYENSLRGSTHSREYDARLAEEAFWKISLVAEWPAPRLSL
jgi:hypothetical protein